MRNAHLGKRSRILLSLIGGAAFCLSVTVGVWFFYIQPGTPNERLAEVLVNSPKQWDAEKKSARTLYLLNVSIRDKVFEDMDFSRVVFHGGEFTNVRFVNCDFSEMGLSNVRWVNVTVEKSSMDNLSVYRSELIGINFLDTSMRRGSIRYSTLENVLFKRLDIHGSERGTFFEFLKMKNVRFEDSRLNFIYFMYPEPENLEIVRSDLTGSGMRTGSSGLSIKITESKNCSVELNDYCK